MKTLSNADMMDAKQNISDLKYDGSYALSEALTFVPDVKIEDDINGGRRLIFS